MALVRFTMPVCVSVNMSGEACRSNDIVQTTVWNACNGSYERRNKLQYFNTKFSSGRYRLYWYFYYNSYNNVSNWTGNWIKASSSPSKYDAYLNELTLMSAKLFSTYPASPTLYNMGRTRRAICGRHECTLRCNKITSTGQLDTITNASNDTHTKV